MNDPNKDAKKGDILQGKNNRNKDHRPPHFIVYLEPYPADNTLFLGAMLTHAEHYGNIPMHQSHFAERDANGAQFRVIYDSSLLVNRLFLKKLEWAPFIKVGELTKEGIEFVEQNIGLLHPEFYPNNA